MAAVNLREPDVLGERAVKRQRWLSGLLLRDAAAAADGMPALEPLDNSSAEDAPAAALAGEGKPLHGDTKTFSVRVLRAASGELLHLFEDCESHAPVESLDQLCGVSDLKHDYLLDGVAVRGQMLGSLVGKQRELTLTCIIFPRLNQAMRDTLCKAAPGWATLLATSCEAAEIAERPDDEQCPGELLIKRRLLCYSQNEDEAWARTFPDFDEARWKAMVKNAARFPDFDEDAWKAMVMNVHEEGNVFRVLGFLQNADLGLQDALVEGGEGYESECAAFYAYRKQLQ